MASDCFPTLTPFPAWRGSGDPFDPVIQDGRLFGRGSCDMKGPMAATITAGAQINAADLKKPLYIVITADEEVSGGGARQVAEESEFFKAERPKHGVIAEPTRLTPVYAHKGGGRVFVTAKGRAAHTSTDKGVSANFLIAPFLAEMAELAQLFKTDESFMNKEFNPPTNGFNMVLDDGGCRPNVAAAKTTCTLSFRPMPNDRSDDVITMITETAEKYGLEATSHKGTPFYVSPDAEIVPSGNKSHRCSEAGNGAIRHRCTRFQTSTTACYSRSRRYRPSTYRRRVD